MVIVKSALWGDLNDGQRKFFKNANGDLPAFHKFLYQYLLIVFSCHLESRVQFFILPDNGNTDRRSLPGRFHHDWQRKRNFFRMTFLYLFTLKNLKTRSRNLFIKEELLGHDFMHG